MADAEPSPIDIIIPVYRGHEETRRCVASVLAARNRRNTELIVIDDCSPEPKLSVYLEDLAREGSITLLRNKANLGFVASVNIGMKLHSDRDVILLNSDTEVAGDWVDRLLNCAQTGEKIGTVTPLSNNATICSYPRFPGGGELPQGCDTASLDALVRTVSTEPIEIPTGVGFCMMIRRKCLEQVGLFDEQAFGKGYGEETDFCMRSARLGWRHLLCPSVFVRHLGGTSFGSSQAARMREASRVMQTLHPTYERQVHRHVELDPARPVRHRIDLERLRTSPKPVVLFLSHYLGGGVEKHLEDLALLLREKAEILVLNPSPRGIDTELRWISPGETFRLHFRLPNQQKQLLEVLRASGVAHVHIHHLAGVDESLRTIAADLKTAYDFTFHDFQPVCPRLHLSGSRDRYCGEPDETGCNYCLSQNPRVEGATDIRHWREGFRPIIQGANRVFAPSQFVVERIRRHFPHVPAILAPPPEPLSYAPVGASSADRRDIAIIGRIERKKGRQIVLDCIADADLRKLPIRFHLFGTLEPPAGQTSERLVEHGAYAGDAELAILLAGTPIHLAWFPSQVPETYGFTLSAALRAGLPVVASDLGAYPERLKLIPGQARLVRWDISASAWNDTLLQALSELKANPEPSSRYAGNSPAAFDYAADYLSQVQKRESRPLHLSVKELSALSYDSRSGFRGGRFRTFERALVRLRYSAPLTPLFLILPAGLRQRLRKLVFR